MLERNAQELRGVIEEQEEMMQTMMINQEKRTQVMYLKDDQLDLLADKIARNIERIDGKIGKRMEEMDQDAVRYMKELARRNAQWSMRLNEVEKKMASSARLKSTGVWNERMAQKDVSKNYEPVYSTNDNGGVGVWDGDSDVVEGTPPRQQNEIIEIVEEVQSQVKQQAQGRGGERTGREVRETEYRNQKTHSYQQAARTTRTATVSTGAQQKSYPCPSCQKPLTYYDKYQRWWCRSCKKWR